MLYPSIQNTTAGGIVKTKYKCLLLSLLIMTLAISTGWAQDYPEIYYMYHYSWAASGGSLGGPDWSSHESSVYYSSEDNPLCIDSLRYMYSHDEEGPDFDVEIDEIRPFNGHLELFPDYFILRSPARYYPSMTQYRISKINYEGYHLQDCLTNSLDTEDYHLKAWHYYDGNMRHIASVVKYNDPPSYTKFECILDTQGRRIEETHYSSPDSLDWQATKHISYEYLLDQPFTLNWDFEKHALYVPGYLMEQCGIGDIFYLNDDYPIQLLSMMTRNSEGQWSEPVVFYAEYAMLNEPDYDRIYVSFFSLDLGYGYNLRYGPHGLLEQYMCDNTEDIPSFDFFYKHSVNTSVPHSPQMPDIRLNLWPNPVKQTADLHYSLPKVSPLQISTYNIKGQLLKREQHNAIKQSGQLPWSPSDAGGKALSNGVYLIRVEGAGFAATKRVIVAK